eukprot:scaffold10856_cov229-Amphora_coffeaeformis.AAC.21
MSANQGTLSTAGTGDSNPLTKEFRQAHELRLNLIYSGFYTAGTGFLCLYNFSHFLFYPAFIFLIVHAMLELRHDIVHKSRYFAHARYTQASPNDRSYGGDLHLANRAQSWFVFLGTSLFLFAIILRMQEARFGRYKAVYFMASLFFFASGATTMLSRGCGSFYFVGRVSGFSIRDQTANFVYVTSTVLLLIIASWQIDHGVFDRPLMIAEYFIRLSWFFASIHYTIADVNRLTKDSPGNTKGVDDAMGMSAAANRNADSDANYVELGSAPPGKSWVGSRQNKKPLDRAYTNSTWKQGSTSPPETARSDPVGLGRTQSDASRTREFFLKGGESVGVQRSGGSGPDPESSMESTLDTLGSMATSHEQGKGPTIAVRDRPDSPSTLRSTGASTKPFTGDASWKTGTGYNIDPYCGMELEPANCTPIVVDPAAGPQRVIFGRDIDSTVSPPTPEPNNKNPNWRWNMPTMEEAGVQMSSFIGGLLPQQSAGASTVAESTTGDQTTRDSLTAQEQFSEASPSPTTETAPVTNSKSESPNKKKPKKNKTKFWGDREIV